MSGSVADNPYRASGVVAAAAGGGGVSWQDVTTASTLTAEAGKGYAINTTSNACTVTLPAAASVGDEIIFTDYARTWASNNVTLDQNSLNFQGGTTPNPVYSTSGQSVHIVYVDATKGWIPISDDDVTYETPPPSDGYYLIVGGGGAGGNNQYHGGGGGAGGLRENYGGTAIDLGQGAVYTVSVGAGGTIPSPGSQGINNSGEASSIIGSGVSLTSAGGGFGGSNYRLAGGSGDPGATRDGGDGGSGGGAGAGGDGIGAAGAGDTPSTSPSQGEPGGARTGDISASTPGCGGGGKGEAVTTNSGDGGDGEANSITGASVTYAGGGGGSQYPGGTTSGGSGGGGAGSSGDGQAGTNGLGGGGGSSERNGSSAGGIGGNGVVFIRLATADYTGTTTGSPTVTTDGTDTIIKWTGDGTYTA
jgi:hypothetical protein